MYQTKYKAALKKAGLKKEDLLKNTVKLFDQVVSAETALALAYKNLGNAEDDDKQQYQDEIDQIEPNLEVIDGELCKKIEKNEFWKANTLRLSQGRANKTKSSGEGTPPASGEGTPPASGEGTPPASGEGTPPASGEGTPPASGEGTPPASGEGTPAASGEGTPPASGEGTPPVVKEEEVPVLKSSDKKTGNVLGWVLGFGLVLGATYLGVQYNNTGKWPWSRK